MDLAAQTGTPERCRQTSQPPRQRFPLIRPHRLNPRHTFPYAGQTAGQLPTMLSLLLCVLSCLSLAPLSPAEKGLEFPQYDGKDRVIDINDKNYRKALKKHSMMCLFYHGPVPDSKELQKQHQMTELVLEVTYLCPKKEPEQDDGDTKEPELNTRGGGKKSKDLV